MIKLFIIADDFTGALDTGVQLASAGANVIVRMDYSFDLAVLPEDVEVVVVNTESRHLGPGEAYDIVYDVVERAIRHGVPHIYKKTDSGLRGNIGAELSAALDASGRMELDFIPAFPQMNRLTIAGVQYIDGIPVASSVFGTDPFNPVKHSSLEDIIGSQSETPVVLGYDQEITTPSIRVLDISSEGELLYCGQSLAKMNGLSLIAGCAGFASVLPKLLKLTLNEEKTEVQFHGGLLVGNGSVNPISIAQLNLAEADGFYRKRLSVHEKLDEYFWTTPQGRRVVEELANKVRQNPRVLLDTNDLPMSEETSRYVSELGLSRETMRKRISHSMGELLKNLMDKGIERTFLVMGGDTLQSFLYQVGVVQMRPIREILPGSVLSEFEWNGKTYHLVSKSGGFGEADLILKLEKEI